MSGLFALLATTPGAFWAVTILFAGGCSIMTGQALAANWRPAFQTIPYALLLGLGDRFFGYALFQAQLLSITGYALDSIFVLALMLISFRIRRVLQMATQYPWLYERSGLFTWRNREPAHIPQRKTALD